MSKTYRLGVTRKAINVMMTALIRVGAGGRSSYLLTTTGRRSGQERTTPVILVETEGQRMARVALQGRGVGLQRTGLAPGEAPAR